MKVCSLSKVGGTNRFSNLGIDVVSGYAIDAMLREVESAHFKALHAVDSISREGASGLSKLLGSQKLLYPGDVSIIKFAIVEVDLMCSSPLTSQSMWPW